MTQPSPFSRLTDALKDAVPEARKEHMERVLTSGYRRYWYEHPPAPSDDRKEAPKEASSEEEIEQNFSYLIRNTRFHLSSQRQERLNQARATFAVAIAALILGILLIFIGVVFIYTVNIAIGSLTSVSSIIVDITSALAFKFNKEANDRLDNIAKELHILDKTSVAMQYINYIIDPKTKDEAIAELIKQLSSSSSTRD